MDSSSVEDTNQQNTSVFFDAKEDQKASEASFVNLSRPLSERFVRFLTFSDFYSFNLQT